MHPDNIAKFVQDTLEEVDSGEAIDAEMASDVAGYVAQEELTEALEESTIKILIVNMYAFGMGLRVS